MIFQFPFLFLKEQSKTSNNTYENQSLFIVPSCKTCHHGVHGQVRIRNLRDRILGSEVVKIHICAAPDIGNFYKKTVRNIH